MTTYCVCPRRLYKFFPLQVFSFSWQIRGWERSSTGTAPHLNCKAEEFTEEDSNKTPTISGLEANVQPNDSKDGTKKVAMNCSDSVDQVRTVSCSDSRNSVSKGFVSHGSSSMHRRNTNIDAAIATTSKDIDKMSKSTHIMTKSFDFKNSTTKNCLFETNPSGFDKSISYLDSENQQTNYRTVNSTVDNYENGPSIEECFSDDFDNSQTEDDEDDDSPHNFQFCRRMSERIVIGNETKE